MGFGGDNELGNILQDAVKLKSAQMGQKRKRYETWPFFVQHTIFHNEKEDFKAWRQLPFDEKMEVAEGLKEAGNKLHKEGNYSDAVDKYEEAGSLFHYCYSTDEGWRKNNRGIDDDVLVLVDDQGTNPTQAKQQADFRVKCCLNIAACKAKLANYDEAIVACSTALELDPSNAKALYRRAEARVKPEKSTAYDQDLAIKDLAQASQIDPENQTVRTFLAELRGDRKIQREKDKKTFTGMFDRGQIVEDELAKLPAAKSVARDPIDCSDFRERQRPIEEMGDEDTLEKRTAEAELLRDLYMRNGKEDEAKDLNKKIEVAKNALKERNNPDVGLDWEHPTPEMIEDAKKHGIDLCDPLVIEELKRLKREGALDRPLEEVEGMTTTKVSDDQAFDLPFSGDSDATPVPWLRYFLLFAFIAAMWRLLSAGAVGWTVRFVWQYICLPVASFIRSKFDSGDTDDLDESRGSFFTRAYNALAGLFVSDDEDYL